jgi:hypothetical protein
MDVIDQSWQTTAYSLSTGSIMLAALARYGRLTLQSTLVSNITVMFPTCYTG